MSAPKAKETGYMAKKAKKLEAKNTELNQQLQATNLSLMNMRQLYEGAVGEKQGLQQALARANQMITALAIQSRGKTLKIKQSTFPKLQEFVGFKVEEVDEDLIISLVTPDDEPEELEDEGDE